MPLTNATPFDLFWHANRGDEHRQSRVLGLLEKHLSERPDDALAQVCKACLMIQMYDEWDAVENRKRAISVALDIIRESSPATRTPVRSRTEFAVGISLAQLPTSSGMDSASAGILQHLIQSDDWSQTFSDAQRQEGFVALGAAYHALGNADQARDAFVQGRDFGLDTAADIFGDYQDLKSRPNAI